MAAVNGRELHVATDPDDASDGSSAAWGYISSGESRWPATAAVTVALLIYVLLPDRLTPGPRYLLPVMELVLLIPLVIANPSRLTPESTNLRALSIALIALINAANAVSLVLLVRFLLRGGRANGRELVLAGVGIWVTQVLVWSLWYWELDRGGPVARCSVDHGPPDFLFPQMENPAVTNRRWSPRFVDYLYLSLTNSTAFSPTDTMPLSARAKLLMGGQALVSLTTIAIVGARAVNILT